MKKNDIITLIISLAIIAVSVYFLIGMLFPAKKTETKSAKTNVVTVPEKIDESTYSTIKTLSDYGKPNLEGIGKTDLFN